MVKGKCRKLLEDEDGMRNYFLNKSLTAQTVEANMGEKVKIPHGENLEVIFYIPRVGKKFKSTTKASVCKYVKERNFNTLLVGV